MAEIIGIASGISTAAQALETFARQVRIWRDVSDRLLDLHQGLNVCQHVFERWQYKWDVDQSQPTVYLRALFGHEGCHDIRVALSSIKRISKSLQVDIDGLIGRALRFGPDRSARSKLTIGEAVEECLRRIRQRTAWKHKFVLSVWNRAGNLEQSLARLEVALRLLESHTHYYLEREHPDIFSDFKRIPGRKFILRLEADRSTTVKGSLTDTLAAQRDAELLHRAVNPDDAIHIGLSVPRIHPKDFALLLRLDNQTQEFLIHPVRIKGSANSAVPRQLSSAVPTLSRSRRPSSPCLVKPSSTTDGFELTQPPVPLLAALELKAPLSTIISSPQSYLHAQTLYPKDQNALATGFAKSALRLIGTPWLRSLSTPNIRWRRTTDGKWTSMLTASPSDDSTTRSLDALCAFYANHPHEPRDVTRHAQIFRLGLVLTELCLRTRIDSIEFDARSQTMKVFLPSPGVDGSERREATATEVAAHVDLLCNLFLGNMVFFCLGALMDKRRLEERDVQGEFVRVVVGCAEGLEALLGLKRRGWNGEGASGRSSSGSSAGGSPKGSGLRQ